MVDFMSVKFVVRESGGSGTICGAWNQERVILPDEVMPSSIADCYVQLEIFGLLGVPSNWLRDALRRHVARVV